MKSTEKSASFKASCPDKHYLAHLFSSCELFMHGSLLKQSLQTAAFIRLLPSVLLRNMSLPLVDNTLLLGGNLCKRGKNPLASNCTIYSRKLVYMKRKNTLKCLFRGKKKMQSSSYCLHLISNSYQDWYQHIVLLPYRDQQIVYQFGIFCWARFQMRFSLGFSFLGLCPPPHTMDRKACLGEIRKT